MIDTNVAAALIESGVAVVCGLIGWAWMLQRRLDATRAEMEREIGKLREESLKAQIAAREDYASIPYLQDVEERLVSAIDRLGNLVETLRQSLMTVMMERGAGRPR